MIRLSSLLLAVIGLAGCAAAPPAYLAAPADAARPVRPLAVAPVTRDARAHAVVEPKGWDELNRRVAPKGGSNAP